MWGISAPASPPRCPSHVGRNQNTQKAFDGLETSLCKTPMVEIEIGVLRSQWLNPRIDSKVHLESDRRLQTSA